MPEKFRNVSRKRPEFPENAHNPEKMPQIPGIMPEFSICLLCRKVMPAYSAWPCILEAMRAHAVKPFLPQGMNRV